MCWRAEGTFTTARRCFCVFVILVPDTELLQTYLLTYLSALEYLKTFDASNIRSQTLCGRDFTS